MTQADQFLEMLNAAGSRGVHTFEMRAAFIGNPSQRKAELEARGYTVRTSPREQLNGKAWGVRYWIVSRPVEAVRAAPTPVPDSPVVEPVSPAASPQDGRLFDVPALPTANEAWAA